MIPVYNFLYKNGRIWQCYPSQSGEQLDLSVLSVFCTRFFFRFLPKRVGFSSFPINEAGKQDMSYKLREKKSCGSFPLLALSPPAGWPKVEPAAKIDEPHEAIRGPVGWPKGFCGHPYINLSFSSSAADLEFG